MNEPSKNPPQEEQQPPSTAAPAPQSAPRAGDRCPRCTFGVLALDDLLNVVCPECGYADHSCFP